MSLSLKLKASPQKSMNLDKRSASYPCSEGADMRNHFVKPGYRSKSFAVPNLEQTEKVKERSVSFMLPQKESYYPYSFVKPSPKHDEPCLGKFDLKIYSNSETTATNYETPCEIVNDQMANIKCIFQYLPYESSVLVELRDLSTHYKPICFQGVKIIQSYEVILEMKYLSSIKNFFTATHNIERKNSKDSVKLKIGEPIKISLKNKNLEKLVMNLILYESNKRNKLLACGYVHVKVKDITSTSEVLEIQEPFHPSSKNQLSPKGTISGSIEWNSNSNQINIKVLAASTVKYNRKEYFVKATLFVGSVEISSLKTESALSQYNEIRILEKLSFSVPFNEKRSEIYRTSVLLQMYEKNRITNELFGRTILGPNMDTECRKSIYCWHKILCTPNKEIQFRGLPLYL
ncbi:uncharacterized protein LOC100200114 isoform X4 [Hydra vulgaris]|uniref:Uncharacterized protein LOC100200114 isoform X4 n=2 Tax=Hydra vulgaris TaxID=6087 RepID=A0ABM4D754_HYDVU